MTAERTRWVAGCMTGTSLDGLDVALARIEGTGLDMTAAFAGMVSRPLGDLADTLRHFANGHAAPPIEYMRAARRLGELHADAVAELCERYLRSNPPPSREGPGEGEKPSEHRSAAHAHPSPPPRAEGDRKARLDFVVAHGQTIWHAPDERAEEQKSKRAEKDEPPAGMSWQLFDPWPLVRRLSVSVCYDLRQADLIAGGQGAPITPLADWVLYRHPTRTRFVVNLGGICNLTYLPAGAPHLDVGARDIGPCNLLIDGTVRLLCPGLEYDKDGAMAARGQPDTALFNSLLDDPIFTERDFRSLGREEFTDHRIAALIESLGDRMTEDVIASTVDAVASLLDCDCVFPRVDEAVLAGGGARNRTLVKRLQQGVKWKSAVLSDDLGIPCEAREAMCFAVLGALSQDGAPITLPQVTGAHEPGRAGAWVYP